MMNRRQSAARLVAVAVAALVAVSIAAPAAAEVRVDPPRSTVSWGACPADVSDPLRQLTCAQVPVPLDYDDPAGAQIEIMISRLASPDPTRRKGVLMLNPGGPGGSGLAFPNNLVKIGLPVSVTHRYDVIGMDTRGIGHSAPISCGFRADQSYTGAVPRWAVDNAAVAAEAEDAREFAEQCAANDVDGRLRHVSTANMARDLDSIRVALGEKKISYYGVSYGTALGAAYASMFPEHSDRFVLDSNIGDTHLDRNGLRRYGLGAEQSFPDFARWAAARHGTYGLGRTPEEVRETYFALGARLDARPVPGLDGHLFRLATFVSLDGPSLYPGTAQLWQTLLRTPDAAAPPVPAPNPAAPAPLSPSDNSWSVFLAVTCNDVDFTDDVRAYQRAVAQDRKRYPVFGAATANITPCAFWAYEPSEQPVPIVDDGPRNILIVQNRRDPATPYAGGVMLREKFDHRSRLVSVDASGHGAYLFGDSACADNITSTFLVGGKLPAKDRDC